MIALGAPTALAIELAVWRGITPAGFACRVIYDAYRNWINRGFSPEPP